MLADKFSQWKCLANPISRFTPIIKAVLAYQLGGTK